MKVNFVCLHVQESTRAIPLGAAMVAENVRQHFDNALSIQIIDCYLTSDQNENFEKINRHQPDCLCFSLYIWNTTESLALIKRIKTESPNVTIVVGGPQASVLPQEFAQHPSIDYVVTGEAENSALELFQGLLDNRSDIPSIIKQGEAPSLDQLPSPYLNQTLDLDKYKAALWELSRGCPFRCAFCFESRLSKSIRRFPLEQIKKELELFQQKEISEVFVLDPTFNYNKVEAKQILRAILKLAPEPHYSFEIRAEFLDQEMTDLFAQLNCSLQIGLQSIHPAVLKNINRSFSKELFTEKVFLLHEAGITYGFDLIFGLPGDSLTGFLESLDYVFTLAPNHVDIFPLTVLPGTELFEQASALGLSYQEENEYRICGNQHFPTDDLAKAEKMAHIVDLFYNQGKAVSWFDLVLPQLNRTASEFFTLLAANHTLLENIESPLHYQQKTISYLFSQTGHSHEAPIIHCLINFFWNNNSVFSEEPILIEIADNYILNPDVQLEEYDYNPLEIISLIQQGMDDFIEISEMVKPQKTRLLLYALDYSVEHYFCSDEEYLFLNSIIHSTKQAKQTHHHPDSTIIARFLEAGIIAEKS